MIVPQVLTDIGMRPYQEDKFDICPSFFEKLNFYAVYDGHGDGKVSEFLRDHLKDIIKTELISMKNTGHSIEQCMSHAFKNLKNLLPAHISVHAGSTAVVVLQNVEKGILYVANVGDSRAIMNIGEVAQPITEDHKPNSEAEYKRIIRAGGFVQMDEYGTARVNGSLALSRAVGDTSLSPAVISTPDIYTVKLGSSNKFVVIATDGLWDVYSSQEVIDIVHLPRVNQKSICADLLQGARARGSTDNLTIILFEL